MARRIGTPACFQRMPGIAQIVLGLDRERGVPDTQRIRAGGLGVGRGQRLGIGALEEVERVAVPADRQEDAAMLGVLLEELEAQDAR